MIWKGEFVSRLSHRIKAGPRDQESHHRGGFSVPPYIHVVSSCDYGQVASFLSQLPQKGLKTPPRLQEIEDQFLEELFSLLGRCLHREAEGAWPSSPRSRGFAMSSSLHLSSGSGHSWLHRRAALNDTDLQWSPGASDLAARLSGARRVPAARLPALPHPLRAAGAAAAATGTENPSVPSWELAEGCVLREGSPVCWWVGKSRRGWLR